MNNKKYVFAGNRYFVLKKMLMLNLNISHIFVVANSYAQRFCIEHNLDYIIIDNKDSLIKQLKTLEYDILISNGLPYILPITKLQEDSQKLFINIHPSLLPDLRGKSPINGAILYERKAGVTCHYMNDNIDDGDIISQIPIDYSEDLDAGLLYQLSFSAEGDVFEMAYKNSFKTIKKQKLRPTDLYVSFNENDLYVEIENISIKELMLKVRAFNVGSKLIKVNINNKNYDLIRVEIIKNKYLNSKMGKYKNLEVVFEYENNLLIKKDNKFLKLCYRK